MLGLGAFSPVWAAGKAPAWGLELQGFAYPYPVLQVCTALFL